MASFLERILNEVLNFFRQIFGHMTCHSRCCQNSECDCTNTEKAEHDGAPSRSKEDEREGSSSKKDN